MSRTYRCRVKRDIREVSRVADKIEYKVTVLDILDEGEMEQEYRKALRDMGAKETEDGEMVLDIEGIEVTVNPQNKTANAKIEDKQDIVLEVDKEEEVYEWSDSKKNAQSQLEARVDRDLNDQVEQRKRDHESKVRGKLEEAQSKIREKLREAANEAHKSALRKKAARIGRVMEDKEEQLANGDRRLALEVDV